MTPIDTRRSLENLKLERDAIALYDALAAVERDEERAAAFRLIAANERRHAEIWAAKLRELGAEVPPPTRPRLRVRLIIALARLFGTRAVADLVQALEGDEEELYTAQAVPEVAEIAADERRHAEIWRDVIARPRGRSRPGLAGVGRPSPEGRDGVAVARRARSPEEIARAERWHRAGRSGTFRAVVFGVSDGLVSNLALVMGVAGAASANPGFVFLAGLAGLLAGASSMAAGEYVSMQSQRELYERQIALEREELAIMPEEEEAELAAVYRAKGFTEEEAAAIAHRLFRNPEEALATLVREELGLDPEELGSPLGAAAGSFVAFALGAAVPVLPYAVGGGAVVFWVSLGLSLLALFGVGAAVSLLTGRSTLFSGLRQVGIGAGAAAVTYTVGSIVGVGVAG
ncbi:MAG TPA: VIT1/CCC1 family protein [Candidatus Binatia bacterium]|nr:VIT1/CCC1 family protein [Candidatus Binatia bacterium]